MDLTIEKIEQYFKNLTGFDPRNFQRETIKNILEYKNTILKAPTGSGKTETAIAPWLFAKLLNPDFPNKLIYVVPLRTLANSLRTRTQNYIENWNKKYNQSERKDRKIVVTLQTGENPEDPRFEGDIIFCTIDQMLSSFLNIPYSVGRGSANVNAGAIFSSYLVFDELHLLDPDRSFATVLKVLEQANGISPFLLMTATLTDELVNEIKSVVGNDVEEIVVKEDLPEIEGQRCRTFEAIKKPLSAKLILDDIKQEKRKRLIIICNTVSVSQGLFRDLEGLIDSDEIIVTLLHSRFLPGDRKDKESNLEKIFGKDWQNDNDESKKCHVLISTQVIEVGINITCEVMHVQLCPMSSLLQRAGRCARFQNETGEVRVYYDVKIEENNLELAEADTEDTEAELIDRQPEKKRKFLPYNDDVCLKTWEVLKNHSSKEKVGFETEDEWIQQVHQDESELQKKRRQNNRLEFENKFRDAIFEGDRSTARQLIRFVDNRTIYVSNLSTDNPTIIDGSTQEDDEEVDLSQLPVFSVPKTSLLKALKEFNENKLDWLFKRVENPQGDKAETYKKPGAKKINITSEKINSAKEVVASFRLIINRKYVSYCKDIGLEINVNNPPEKADIPEPEESQQPYKDQYEYHMDTYTQHLKMMWDCWHNKFPPKSSEDKLTYTSIRDELLKAGGRFIKEKIFTEATKEDAEALFELLVMFAILTHDLGKLQVKWQQVMRGWQQLAYDKFKDHPDFRPSAPKFHLLAHTDHKESVDEEEYKAYMKQNKRPPHAVESAFLAEELLESHLLPILETSFNADDEQIENIFGVIQMAAGRHHSAWAKGWKLSDVAKNQTLELVGNANEAIAKSWQQLSKSLKLPNSISLRSEPFELERTSYPTGTIDLNIFDPDSLEYQQLYALVVRALRICDMRSVQLIQLGRNHE
jgi:CRISPR-associated endonuclease/helicase Cas3